MKNNTNPSLFISESKLKTFALSQDESFVLYDEASIRSSMKKLCNAFSSFASFRQYFPIMYNTNKTVLRILRECGSGIRCETYNQLLIAKEVGFQEDEILYYSMINDKKAQDLALRLGATFVIDDAHCLPSEMPKNIILSLHIDKAIYRNDGLTIRFSAGKCGMSMDDAIELASHLKSYGIRQIGLLLHYSTSDLSTSYYPAVAEELFQAALVIKQKCGIDISCCNLSDGLGINSEKPELEPDLHLIADLIYKKYMDMLYPFGFENLRIETTLGRKVLQHQAIVVSKIEIVKHFHPTLVIAQFSNSQLSDVWPLLSEHKMTILGKSGNFDHVDYEILGSQPLVRKIVAKSISFPKIEAGDYLIIHDCGVYCATGTMILQGYDPMPEFMLQEDGTIVNT